MSTKAFVRIVVVAALAAWPGVETYRYVQALQQRDAAKQQELYMASRLDQIKKTASWANQPSPKNELRPIVNKQ